MRIRTTHVVDPEPRSKLTEKFNKHCFVHRGFSHVNDIDELLLLKSEISEI